MLTAALAVANLFFMSSRIQKPYLQTSSLACCRDGGLVSKRFNAYEYEF